jgi:GGDEF domain-containing protein
LERDAAVSALAPVLQHRPLRVLLIAAPGITAAVAILTALESDLVMAVILNVAVGIIMSSSLFLAVAMVARKAGEEREGLARAAEQGLWRGRLQRLSVENEETGFYNDWYFRLRLQEEIERSRRYKLHFALLVIKPLALHRDVEVQAKRKSLGERIRRHLRRSDLPALLTGGDMAILMPHTVREAAETVRRRLTKDLKLTEPQLGLACFPGDGEDASALLAVATDATIGQAMPQAA